MRCYKFARKKSKQKQYSQEDRRKCKTVGETKKVNKKVA